MRYEHHNSIHLVHNSELETFIIYLVHFHYVNNIVFNFKNSDPIHCPYDNRLNAVVMDSISVQSYSIGGSRNFGDLIYTRHAFNIDEVEHFTSSCL